MLQIFCHFVGPVFNKLHYSICFCFFVLFDFQLLFFVFCFTNTRKIFSLHAWLSYFIYNIAYLNEYRVLDKLRHPRSRADVVDFPTTYPPFLQGGADGTYLMYTCTYEYVNKYMRHLLHTDILYFSLYFKLYKSFILLLYFTHVPQFHLLYICLYCTVLYRHSFISLNSIQMCI